MGGQHKAPRQPSQELIEDEVRTTRNGPARLRREHRLEAISGSAHGRTVLTAARWTRTSIDWSDTATVAADGGRWTGRTGRRSQGRPLVTDRRRQLDALSPVRPGQGHGRRWRPTVPRRTNASATARPSPSRCRRSVPSEVQRPGASSSARGTAAGRPSATRFTPPAPSVGPGPPGPCPDAAPSRAPRRAAPRARTRARIRRRTLPVQALLVVPTRTVSSSHHSHFSPRMLRHHGPVNVEPEVSLSAKSVASSPRRRDEGGSAW